MADIFLRTERLIGEEALLKLKNKHVAVFGVGGVGSYVVEALARCGIGRLTIIDKDVVDVTNINRQLIALHSTIGKVKVDIAKNRILDINPDAKVNALPILFNAETKEQINFEDFDYVVDAIDMVTAKLLIAEMAQRTNTPVICCMGTGGKMNPSMFQVADIKKTYTCPLAKVMRRELKSRGIYSLKVVFSPEQPVKSSDIIPSISFVPSSAGLLIASEVIKDLIKT